MKKRTTLLAGLLSGWGIRQNLARIIAGALAGALAAAGYLASEGEDEPQPAPPAERSAAADNA